jgi:hypothetical protein
MSHFVETDDGWVNLDHVLKVERAKVGERLLFLDRAGEIVAKLDSRGIDANELLAPVMPAAPGTAAVCIWVATDEGRPEEKDVIVTERAVIGWRFGYHEYPTPVLCEPWTPGEHVLLRQPDDSLVIADDCTFASVEDAKAGLLAHAQRRWDEQRVDAKAPRK